MTDITDNKLYKCDFCGETSSSRIHTVEGISGSICFQCILFLYEVVSYDILPSSERPTKSERWTALEKLSTLGTETTPGNEPMTAKQFKEHLDKTVIGQDQAKKALAIAVVNHLKMLKDNSNFSTLKKTTILLIGPTGSGKTLLAEAIAKSTGKRFVIADATALSETGYVGKPVEDIFIGLLKGDTSKESISMAENGIVYIDEIDKIARKHHWGAGSSDEGVQRGLLTILEGSKITVSPKGRNGEAVTLDTRRILFIVGGAFSGITDIVDKRVQKTGIGFSSKLVEKNVVSKGAYKKVTTDDLVAYGFLPEFVGRLGATATLEPLTADDLVQILTDTEGALVPHYKRLFEIDGVTLEFDKAALKEVANLALARKTGARGLKNILEGLLEGYMFELGDSEKKKVRITKKAVQEYSGIGDAE